MKEDLKELEPKRVFQYFYEICQIPHGSYHVDQISDYLVAFAKEHDLEYEQDSLKNVIIIKEASTGYEECPPIILQGHMDMVTVKEEDCHLDLETDGLELAIEDGYLYAKKTSLGGDDGIALAYALAVLESDTIAHPRVEAVFTVNEEVGMDGALGIDLSVLKGKRLLNIDSEEEGILLTSCAGGMRVHATLPIQRENTEGKLFYLKVKGLQGGHSGTEIHRGRGNAICLLGKVLEQLSMNYDIQIVTMEGGEKDNAIPAFSYAKLLVKKDEERIESIVHEEEQALRQEYKETDADVTLEMQWLERREESVITVSDSLRIAQFLTTLPNGVQKMSSEIPGMVETSLNLGIMKLNQNALEIDSALRSSKSIAKEQLHDDFCRITERFGGGCTKHGEYPEWEYRVNSPLRDIMVSTFRELFGKDPIVTAVHAGLECGIISQKIEDLDCISFGPNLLDIHTTKEKMEIASVQRTWKYLLKVLERKE